VVGGEGDQVRGVNFIAAKIERIGLKEFVSNVPDDGSVASEIDGSDALNNGSLQWLSYHGIIRRLDSIPTKGYLTVWGRGEYWYDIMGYLRRSG
jgi:hypothetical protein